MEKDCDGELVGQWVGGQRGTTYDIVLDAVDLRVQEADLSGVLGWFGGVALFKEMVLDAVDS